MTYDVEQITKAEWVFRAMGEHKDYLAGHEDEYREEIEIR